jgi:hypothetical protein
MNKNLLYSTILVLTTNKQERFDNEMMVHSLSKQYSRLFQFFKKILDF